ncbi:MAG: NADH-quinone oxidoreductase subunit M [Thaumarchaeota archaeon]|nr:NADH-quinone oxidoreductase subunit M [Nitrososphaerota archaeon]
MILSLMIFIPIIGAAVALLLGRAGDKVVKGFTLAVSLVTLGIALNVFVNILQTGAGANYSFVEGPISWIPAFSGVDYYLGVDGLSAPLVLISAVLTVLVVFGSFDLITTRIKEYYALILIFEGAVIGVFTSLNLIFFYVFWELVLIPMFFFIGIWGGPRRKYAAMKFIIFTYVGSAIMLLGFLGLYFFTSPNTFNMPDLARLALNGGIPFWLQGLVAVATFVGFGVKLPVVPFHTWLPDAHVEAPAPISVFLAGVMLKMGGYGFLRVNLQILPEVSTQYAWIFIAFGIVTMFYGALVALVQKDIKRMVALTSINHMGFVLLGGFSGNLFGISGAIFQMFNHAAAIGLLFMLSGYIHEQAGTRDVTMLRGLRFTMPRTAVLVILGSLAGMGAPIFSTFISEYMVIIGAISVNPIYAVVVLVPGITAGYFMWVVRRTVMSQPKEELHQHDLSRFSALTLSVYLIPLIILLIFPSLLLSIVDPLSRSVVAALGGA